LKNDFLIERTAVGARLFLQPQVQVGWYVAQGKVGHSLEVMLK
jgi:hypothetical protein